MNVCCFTIFFLIALCFNNKERLFFICIKRSIFKTKGIFLMGVIKSDLNQASSLATELSNATQAFSQSGSISKASATTVLGNQKAGLTIDQTSSLLTSFLGALQRDSQNIQSIATDFEATDQSLAKSLFSIN